MFGGWAKLALASFSDRYCYASGWGRGRCDVPLRIAIQVAVVAVEWSATVRAATGYH